MMNVLSFDSHLLQWVRSQESSDLCHNSSVHSLEDDGVRHLNDTVNKHNINCSSETFDNLDFEHSAIKAVVLLVQLLWDSFLALSGKISDQIWKTFTSDGRCWHKTDILINIGVFPVDACIETLLSESEGGLLKSVFELGYRVSCLGIKGVSGVRVL